MNGIQLENFTPVVRARRDANGKIVGGLVVGDILYQNQAIILSIHPGELKEFPEVGVGISDMLLDADPLYWKARIREQLEIDGQTVEGVKITTTGIEIKAKY